MKWKGERASRLVRKKEVEANGGRIEKLGKRERAEDFLKKRREEDELSPWRKKEAIGR